MSAGILREAAKVLRERAQAARPERGHWHVQQFLPEDREFEHQAQVMTDQRRESYGFVASSVFIDDAHYIATMHPGVGLALADLLDEVAAHAQSNDEHDGLDPYSVITGYGYALHIARLIVGGAS